MKNIGFALCLSVLTSCSSEPVKGSPIPDTLALDAECAALYRSSVNGWQEAYRLRCNENFYYPQWD